MIWYDSTIYMIKWGGRYSYKLAHLEHLLAQILPCYKVLLLANKKFPSRDLCCILLPRIDLGQPDKKQTWKCRSGTNYWTELLTRLCQEIEKFPSTELKFSSSRAQLTLHTYMNSVVCIVYTIWNMFGRSLNSISLYLPVVLLMYPDEVNNNFTTQQWLEILTRDIFLLLWFCV